MSAPVDFDIPVAGGSLGGWVPGSGDPVLLLHGGPGLSDYTEGLEDEFKTSFTAYRYQQRGLPPSTLEGPFDLARHVDDALAVLKANNLDRVWLVGHSWGGHLALFFASLHPDRCRGVSPRASASSGPATSSIPRRRHRCPTSTFRSSASPRPSTPSTIISTNRPWQRCCPTSISQSPWSSTRRARFHRYVATEQPT
jgi:pimeloyl-ACP methyl ester carboxylesterase